MKIKSLPPTIAFLVALSLFLSPEVLAQGVSVLPGRGEVKGMDIATGRVHMVHLPALVMYWIQILLQIAGGFAVIMIMVGGVQYMIGTISNNKEQGKNTLIYAISGLILAFFAWWIVELIQVWLTS